MKFKKVIALAIASMFVLSSCGGNKGNDTASSKPDTTEKVETTEKADSNKDKTSKDNVVIAVNANFITLDPHAGRDSLSNSAMATMAEGLVRYSKDLKLEPNLAEKYEVSADGLVYDFKLIEGVKFHDGTPFNAEAVRVNIERVTDESKALRHARTFKFLEKMEVIDEYNIKLTLSQPYMAFLSRLEAFKIISPKAIAENEKNLAREIVGTGPFKFVSWTEGDNVVMEKNEEYRDAGKYNIKTVTWKFVPENGTRLSMLEAGEADVIYPVPLESIESLKSNADIRLEVAPSTVLRYVTMNELKEPFNNPLVRKALNHAIDKDAYIKVVKNGYAIPLESTMSPLLPYYSANEPYEYNIEKAKELLKEAGYPDGFKTTLWGSNDTETVTGMNFIHQQLSQIGVEVEVVPLEEGILSDKVYNTTPETTELDMWYVSWSASDPDNATRSLFQSDMIPPAGANTNYYSNKEVDDLIAEGNKATEFEKQFENYKKVQEIIWNDAVWMFMGIDQNTSASRVNVEGIGLSPDGSSPTIYSVDIK